MPLELTDILSGRALDLTPQPRPPVAALTMELQRGVMGDLASFPELAAAAARVQLVEHAAHLLAACRSHSFPVVHCTAEFRADRTGTTVNTPLHTTLLRRPEHLLEGTAATELVLGIGEPTDHVSSRRHGVSPFGGTGLHETLQGLGVRVLLVTGVSVNLGIIGTCIEAVNLGYQVVVATDAVAGVPIDYAETLLQTSIALVAALGTTDEIIEALNQVAG